MNPGSKVQRSWSRQAKRPLTLRRRARSNWRSLANRRLLAGLTTRGTVATRVPEMKSLVLELDMLAMQLNSIYELLPKEVQGRCLRAACQLAKVRSRLT